MQFYIFYQRFCFVRLVNKIGSTTIVSETNLKYMTDFRATRMPILAVTRLYLIDLSSIEHNSACLNTEIITACNQLAGNT